MSGPIKRTKLADRAYASIRDLILKGEFAEGTRLAETRLSELLGISRAPVREALNRLASVGLVQTSAHRGAQVIELSDADVVDLHQVAAGLQTTATRLFIVRGADTAPLRKAVEEMGEAIAASNHRELIYRELDFHRAIAEASGNLLAKSLFVGLSGPLVLALNRDAARLERDPEVAALYAQTLEAIEAGDDRRAATLLGERAAADAAVFGSDGRAAAVGAPLSRARPAGSSPRSAGATPPVRRGTRRGDPPPRR